MCHPGNAGSNVQSICCVIRRIKLASFRDREFAEFTQKIRVPTRRSPNDSQLLSLSFQKTRSAPQSQIKNKLVRHSAIKAAKFSAMKWMLDRIRQLIAAYSQKRASGHEPIKPDDPYQTDLAPSSEPQSSSKHVEANFDATPKEIGVEDGLKDIPGVTMLVTFGEHGIRSIEDLADCATDDLEGWSESKDGKTIRHAGILSRLRVSRKACEAIIMNARTKAGWFK